MEDRAREGRGREERRGGEGRENRFPRSHGEQGEENRRGKIEEGRGRVSEKPARRRGTEGRQGFRGVEDFSRLLSVSCLPDKAFSHFLFSFGLGLRLPGKSWELASWNDVLSKFELARSALNCQDHMASSPMVTSWTLSWAGELAGEFSVWSCFFLLRRGSTTDRMASGSIN